jgi:hypothetical protein
VKSHFGCWTVAEVVVLQLLVRACSVLVAVGPPVQVCNARHLLCSMVAQVVSVYLKWLVDMSRMVLSALTHGVFV